jgi:hypothetical protein
MFRRVQASLGELEDLRARTGDWPSVDELAAARLPPFAPDPLDDAGYRWQRLTAGGVINYLGVPDARANRPTLLVVIVEPEPGAPIDPSAPVDEIHHRLPDGRMLHVTVWTAPGVRALDAPTSAPYPETGWRRITTRADF